MGSAFADVVYGADGVANRLDGGAGNDYLEGRGGDDVLFGGLGDDRLDGGGENDILRGEDGADSLYGDAGIDTLEGGVGNDRLEGGIGADVLNGGDGVDTAYYSASESGVTVRLDFGTGAGGDAQGDTLISIEGISGTSYNDVLYGADGVSNRLEGGDGDDYLNGLSGDDVLIGGAGADTLVGGVGNNYMDGGSGADAITGGDGYDTVTYDGSDAAVTVHLDGNANTGGHAEGDTLSGVENLVGSAHNDYLYGSDTTPNRLYGGDGDDYINAGTGNDYLSGGAGNDNLVSSGGNNTFDGGAGADTLTGGTGYDTATYASSSAAVTVYLGGQAGIGGDGAGDVLVSIENLEGSSYDDFLYGDGLSNQLSGRGGNDQLSGGDGDDVLSGGAGVDRLLGGMGNDTLDGGLDADVIDGGDGLDTVSYQTSTASVSVYLTGAPNAGGDAAGDTFTSIENVTGSDFADTIHGSDDSANRLTGGGGNDVLYGLGGDDTLIGGGGGDILAGGAGNDNLTGGDGADTILLRAGGGQDRVYDFSAAEDRFDLGGDVWTAVSVGDYDADGAADDTLMSFSGGSVALLNVTGLSLGDWNALITG